MSQRDQISAPRCIFLNNNEISAFGNRRAGKDAHGLTGAQFSFKAVSGGGFVYVRGLGERYSLALLNGLPLPSPQPLRRAVPLDLFPTSVLESVVIQKTFSPDRTAEFGGGVVQFHSPKGPWSSELKQIAPDEPLKIEIKAPGYQPVSESVLLADGETKVLEVTLTPSEE